MNITTMTEDIHVHCITASSFPDGVQEAHKALRSLLNDKIHYQYFGLSWPDRNDGLIYKAAAEESQEGELAKHSLEKMVILKGSYLFIDLVDFMKDLTAFGRTFQELIHDDRVDPNGFCIEWYLNENLCRCMVKTIDYENK